MVLFVGAALTAVLFAACGTSGEAVDDLADGPVRKDRAEPIVVPPGNPIVIGSSSPLTGSDAESGTEDRDAVIAAVNLWTEVNTNGIKGHAIAVRAEDDGCTSSDQTVLAAKRFLRVPGLVGVIGPNCSAGARAAIPVYAEAGLVAISGSATESGLTTAGRTTFFRTIYRNDLQGTLIGLFVGQQLGAKTAYLVDDGESYGEDLVAAARRSLQEIGVSAKQASVQRGAVDFSAVAKQIASENPDFVGFAGFNPEAALFYRQLRDAGYGGAFGGTDAAAGPGTFIGAVGAKLAEGAYFSGCSPRLRDPFLRAFREIHGALPDSSSFTPQLADATRILLDAVARVAEGQQDGSLVIDPVRLVETIRATAIDDGFSGRIAFDANGDRRVFGLDIDSQALAAGWTGCQVRNGRFEILFP